MKVDEPKQYEITPEVLRLFEDAEGQYGSGGSKAKHATRMRARFKQAAIAVVNFFKANEGSTAFGVIRYQLLKSATSAAANYRAACRARSKREFYAKICIVVEETDETLFWLEILHDSQINADADQIRRLGKEWQELLMIVAKAKSITPPDAGK